MNADKRTPVITLLLIAANIAAAFILFLQPDLVDQFGFVASKPSVLAALTCLFLHANLIHLLGNMVFLAAAGPATEMAVGSLRFFGVYIAGGLAGVAAHWALTSSKDVPLIGASGAVSACVALGAVRFYRSKVPLAPSLSVPLVFIVVVWLLLQVVGGMVRIGEATGGISYWAHVGGAVAGLLLALAYRAPRDADRFESQKLLTEMGQRGPAAVLAAADQHLSDHPKDFGAMVEKAEALARLGEKDRSAETFLLAIDALPTARQAEIVERASSCGVLQEMPSMKRTLLAEKLKSGKQEAAAKLLDSVVSGPKDDDQRPDAILALAEMKRDADPAGADRLVAELFESYPLHPAAELARAKGWTG